MATRKTSKRAKRSNPTKPTPKGARKPRRDWRTVFLATLTGSPNVLAAAKAAHVDRSYVYQVRVDDAKFAADWDAAIASSTDTAVGEGYRRAVKGVLKPVYQQGKLVGHVREYSDTLLIFLLKSHRPEVYRETYRQEHTGKDGGPIEFGDLTDDERAARVVAILDRARTRRTQPVDPGAASPTGGA